LKVDSVFAEVTRAGRLFQRRGSATPKARSSAVDSRDLRMTSLLDEADRSRVLELSSAAHCKSSAKYWGAVLVRLVTFSVYNGSPRSTQPFILLRQVNGVLQPVWLGLRRGGFTCVGWKVNTVWSHLVTSHSC